MNTNRLTVSFRPFAPWIKHSFSGAYLTLIFEEVSTPDSFHPTVRVVINDIRDANFERLRIDRFEAAVVARRVHLLFGIDRTAGYFAAIDGEHVIHVDDVYQIRGGDKIRNWPELVSVFAPKNQTDEEELNRLFWLDHHALPVA